MVITSRKSSERGTFNNDWLNSFHTFSFADYYDAQWMGFRKLRVINEDVIQPSRGFDTHSHRDMEIITYVLKGTLEHKDSMGNQGHILAGDVQYMSAGKGVTHSEYNASNQETVHLLQIWIQPNQASLPPRYAQISIKAEDKLNKLKLIVSENTQNDVINIHQQTNIFASVLEKNKNLDFHFSQKKYGWLQLISGTVQINNLTLAAGDAAIIDNESIITITGLANNSEFLFFELE